MKELILLGKLEVRKFASVNLHNNRRTNLYLKKKKKKEKDKRNPKDKSRKGMNLKRNRNTLYPKQICAILIKLSKAT